MAIQKEFVVQLFEPDGTTFVRTVPQSELKNLPSFNARMNGGLGELELDLNLPFDDFGYQDTLDFMYVADVYAMDEANPRGRRIYRGFTSRLIPYARGADQGVRATCLGLGSLGSLAHYSATHTSVDPETIGRAVVDDLAALYQGLITYSAASTDAVGTNITYTFTDQRHFDALKKVHELTGGGWWWSIDRDGVYNLRDKPSTPTHLFTIGKDVDAFEATNDAETIVNYVRVDYDGGSATYQDATSIATYGRRSKIIGDTSIPNLGTADQRGNKEIADNKDPKVRARLEINTEYDLESIQVGDTCTILNLRSELVFPENAQIVSLSYRADSVTIELGQSSDFGLELQSFVG